MDELAQVQAELHEICDWVKKTHEACKKDKPSDYNEGWCDTLGAVERQLKEKDLWT